MKPRICRKKVAWCLILAMIIGMMGCKKEDQGKESNSNAEGKKSNMGRYMEESINLPKEMEQSYSCAAVNEKGELELYSLLGGGINKGGVKKHTLQKDGTFLTEESAWLTNSSLVDSNSDFQVTYGEDGNIYAYFNIYKKNGSESVVLKASKDLKKSEQVSVPYFNKPNKELNGAIPRINNIGVLADGSILADNIYADGLQILSADNKKVEDQLSAGKSEYQMKYPFYLKGKQLVTVNADKSGLTIYHTESKEVERTVDYKLKDTSYVFTLLPDGGIYIADSDGIHKRGKDGMIWETLVDGGLNSLSLPNRNLEALIIMQGEKDDFYTFGSNGEGKTELMHYYFDSQVNAVPEKEISIYSLVENATLRQAAVQYQKKHTDIRINYQVAMGEEGGNISDYIKTLNTELLAGAGAEILILDDLPMDTYIEKGVLADVSDLLGTSNEKNSLLTNISGSYQYNGKQYGMPLRFGVPLMLGEKESLEAMNSLALAADYAKSMHKDKLFEPISYSKLAELFMAVEWSNLFDESHKLKESDFIQFLNDLKVISNNVGASEEGEATRHGSINVTGGYKDLSGEIFSLPVISNFFGNKNKLGMEYTTDIYSASMPIAAAREKNIEMSSFAGILIPQGIVALNKAGKNIEIAKEFYQYLFSEEVQDMILYDGYPVNKNSCSKWIDMEYENYSFAMTGGSGESFICRWPAKEDRMKLMKIIESLSVPLENDRILKDSIKDGILSMLKGEKSAEEAAAAVQNKVNMYMAE